MASRNEDTLVGWQGETWGSGGTGDGRAVDWVQHSESAFVGYFARRSQINATKPNRALVDVSFIGSLRAAYRLIKALRFDALLTERAMMSMHVVLSYAHLGLRRKGGEQLISRIF